MSFKRSQKKAKDYVREEVQSIENAFKLPIEERIEKAPEEFNALMNQFKEELEQLEKEQTRFDKNNVLKNKLVHLYVTGQYTQAQIARILGVSPTTVHRWLSDEEVRNMIECYQIQESIIVDSSLKALRIKALKTMSELMDSDNDLVALQASKDILDRTGHKAIEKKEIKVEMTYEERIKNMLEGVEYVIDDESVETQINTEGGSKSDE